MKTLQKLIPVLLSVLLSLPAGAVADRDAYRQALDLYRHGMYGRAMAMFEGEDDDVCRDYATLCAIRLRLPQCRAMIVEGDLLRPGTALNSTIHHLWGLSLFEDGEYDEAFDELSKADVRRLSRKERTELDFKLGYCRYASGDKSDCIPHFEAVHSAAHSQYSAPSRFILGSICYAGADFVNAEKWFRLTLGDGDFSELSEFHLVECRFMLKDYDYVIENGERIFAGQSPKRQKHLSRLLSEAYLVKGNASKARDFMEMEDTDPGLNTYENLFHKASVLYAVGDYEGAIENFTGMENPSDSLGQIAMYQLGYSYIQIHNKVDAMGAFKQAAATAFNPSIAEDAFFNYAKLSCEVNNDINPLRKYRENFSDSKKVDELYRHLALYALRDKKYSEAVEYYDEIEVLPESDRMNYTKASFIRSYQLLSGGSYKEAIKYLRCVPHFLSKNDPVARLSRYWLADTYYRVGSWEESLKVYNELFNTSSSAPDPTASLLPYNIAFCHFRMGDYSQAARWFDVYLRSSDRMVREDALIRRADCDFERGQYRDCLDSYRRAVEEYPDHLYAYYYRSVAYDLLKDNAGCIAALKPVLTMRPGIPYYTECMNALGSAYIRSGNYDQAGKVFDLLLKNSSENSSRVLAYMGTGIVMRNTGRNEDALVAYKAVVRLMPRSTYCDDALQAIKTIYAQLGHPETFLKYLDSVGMGDTQSDSDRDELYFNTAQQVFLSGNYSKAKGLLNMYLEKCPSGANLSAVHFYLGETCRYLGQKESSIGEYRKSLEIDADSPFCELALLGVARVCYELERFNESMDAYAALCGSAKIQANADAAQIGAMRAAYYGRSYDRAIEFARIVLDNQASKDVHPEAMLLEAKSLLNTSRRNEALAIFEELSKSASTPQGAEAFFAILQSKYDLGQFDAVESSVYDFATKCGDQMYWLAKAYILLGDAFLARGNIDQARITYISIRDEYVASSNDDDIQDIVNQKLAELDK